MSFILEIICRLVLRVTCAVLGIVVTQDGSENYNTLKPRVIISNTRFFLLLLTSLTFLSSSSLSYSFQMLFSLVPGLLAFTLSLLPLNNYISAFLHDTIITASLHTANLPLHSASSNAVPDAIKVQTLLQIYSKEGFLIMLPM